MVGQGLSSKQFATLKNMTSIPPLTNENSVAGKFLTYRDLTGKRLAHGGGRTVAKFKHSLPDMPLVTIITVCLNSLNTIEQCIQSVLQQSYENIEYLIIDGASTDGTIDLIKKYGDKVDYFLSEPDRGLYHAMNKGIELASGDYILILNSDDWYTSDCVESLVKAKKYAGTDFVSSLAQVVDKDGNMLPLMRSMHYDDSMRLRMSLRHETMLLSADIYNKVGYYDETLSIIADFDFTLKLYLLGYTHYELPRPLLFFRNTGVSNKNLMGINTERKVLLQKQFRFLSDNELNTLVNREQQTGKQLLELVKKHPNESALVRSLKSYIKDHISFSKNNHWKDSAPQLMDFFYRINLKHSPKVSIILPVYNSVETLRECIDSIIAQTLKDFEIIFINDQSRDNSQSIIDEYCARDPRCIALSNEVNVGHGASRNHGVRAAKGAYLFHVDPDDIIPPTSLEKLYSAAIKHGSEMVKGAYIREQLLFGQKPEKSERKGLRSGSAPVINTSLAQMPELLKTTEGHWSYLYKSELAKRVPYPTDLKMGQDSMFMVSVLIQAKSISLISDIVYQYRANPNSAMNTFNFRKYKDSLEWRRRAWHLLKDAGMRAIGDRLLQAFWGDDFFRSLAATVTEVQLKEFFERFRQAYAEAEITAITHPSSPFLKELFPRIIVGEDDWARTLMLGGPGPKIASSVRSGNNEAPPSLNENGLVGKYRTYPDLTGQRIAEGGSRLGGKLKASLPEKPLVTIITVCLNSEKTLKQSIESVFRQTYENIEYIIIDGASTDGTLQLIQQYEDDIDYYLSEPDRGLYHAMNKGLELARGAYILILNSDDWYERECVEILVNAMKYSGASFVSALAQNVDQTGNPLQVIRGMPYDEGLRLRMTLRHETMLLSSAIYEEIGAYDERYRIIADFQLTLRLFERGYSHHEVPHSLMFFRNTGISSTNMDKLFAERAILLAEQFPFMDSADISILTNYKLAPDSLVLLLNKYSNQTKLIEALISYVLYLKNAGSVKWKNFDTSIFKIVEKPVSSRLRILGKKSGLRVATLCSMDHGGAGTGTQRRVEALRRNGIEARIFSLVVKSAHSFVERVVPQLPAVDTTQQMEVWKEVRKRAILPAKEVSGFCANELFSLTDSVVNFNHLAKRFADFDVIHLHWVVGMFDFERAADNLSQKPVVWTLADMNAFTGGCHYSEGCEEYKRACKKCPLLGGKSDLAHMAWKIKKAAYSQIRNFHVICPSRWMVERAAQSSLFGDKMIHYIPNAFPTDRLRLTNKVVARLRLGLPINKKLLIFGADSLANYRKGGDLLKRAIDILCRMKQRTPIEIIVFGNNSIELPLPVHRLGYILDDVKLALAYSAADAYLFPSREDNAPLTVGEALLCGTPVVAFPVGNVPDIIQHGVTGYIAKYLDVADFSKGIEWALAADEKVNIAREIGCRVAASSFHDPQVSVERHLKVYHEALRN